MEMLLEAKQSKNDRGDEAGDSSVGEMKLGIAQLLESLHRMLEAQSPIKQTNKNNWADNLKGGA